MSNSFKEFLDQYTEVDNFQILIESSLSEDTPEIKFSWTSDQYFLPANRQTNGRWNITSSVEV